MQRRSVMSTAPGTRAEAFGPIEWGLLAAIAAMWGSSFLFIAEGVAAFAPPVVTVARLVLGAATLSLFRRSRAPIDRADWPRLVVLALVWMAAPLLLIPVGQQWVDSGVAGMINGGMPLFAGVIAVLLLRRLPGPAQAVGLVVGFAGVILITLPAATGATGSPLGVALILAATACYGLAVNLSIPMQHRYGALPVLLRAQVVSLGVALPFGLAGLGSSAWSGTAALSMVALGVFGTGFAYVAMAVLAGRAGATRGSIAIYFIPIVAVLLGVVVRDESIPAVSLAGMGLVLVGAWLSSRRER